MPLKSGSRVGAYEIVSPIGAGGMGEVYLARDSRLDRRVAIKALPAHLLADSVARERLPREALSAAALDHPFICKVFELVEAATEALLATGISGFYWSSTTAAATAAAAAGNWTAAEACHQKAIAEADGNAVVLWQPDARDWYARMLLDRGAPGDVDRARALLGDAIARYDALGSSAFAQRASQRLSAL